MALNVSLTATMPSSQFLSSSISSSASHRHSSSQISKIYRQASTLFLTRRLPESLSTILPVITAPSDHDLNGNTSSVEPAPIAGASRTTRIKVWSLYLTILNAVIELDPQEGKQAFGSQEWRSWVAKVREGEVWGEVVANGYGGVEGDVDSDVVINLATLLLAHARNQTLNQQRLENYLAASSRPKLDVSEQLQSPRDRPHSRGLSPSKTNGSDTPRDLNSRVKILELYTLHVLLRNNEWDYAREFISISEVLDEERREAFLQALQSLQDEQNEVARREREVARREEEQLQRDIEEARRRRAENEERERQVQNLERRSSITASEVDYGIEHSLPNGPTNGSTKASSTKGRTSKVPGKPLRTSGAATISHASRPSVSGKKTVAGPPPSFMTRARTIIASLRKLLENMTSSFARNPMVLIRTLAFIIVILLVLGRKDVKERVKNLVRRGWDKVRATAGMGVKVSYI